jgi:hypothetical protein
MLGVELIDALGVDQAAEDAGALGLLDAFGAGSGHALRVAADLSARTGVMGRHYEWMFRRP